MDVIEQPSDVGPWMTQNFEGWRDRPYLDTKKKRTVGWGFNMDDPVIAKQLPVDVLNGSRALTLEEAQPIYESLYANAIKDAMAYVGGPEIFGQMDQQRQNAIVDMAYNLGATKLAGFQKMQKAIRANDWNWAANEAMDSNWYRQVGNRSRHIVKIMREGSKKTKK